ncbi:hypothetical protein KKB43_04800 [Patescibacteria group bacterium]|nr:hypothetical protein [Patescibacteria group bacterium]MBU4580307.1 hypothetical protein [Patescibacteria group bacterium]
MKIIHSINNHQIERDIDDKENVGFLLANGLGGYGAFAKTNDSRYNGWFAALGQKLYKIIDEIKLQDEAKIVKIKNDFYKAERFFDSGLSESVFIPHRRNSLVYELSKESSVEIVLDMREPYDGRNFGRNYEILEEDGLTIVKYLKNKNWEEDKGEGKEYEIYLAIDAGGGKVEKIGRWTAKHYSYDEKRASQPFDKYVYKALKINAKKIVFSAALDKKTAKSESKFVFKNANELENKDKKRLDKFAKHSKVDDEKTIVSCAAAKNSLASLMARDGKKFGICAGFPWFFQFWTSDESICLKSASQIDRALAEKILLRDIGFISDDGKMYDVLDAKTPDEYSLNMDAAGWLFKRAAELLKKGALNKKKVKNKITVVIENLRKKYVKDGFAHSEAGETWMDTFYAGDLRDGARIEIQALMLSMYKEAYELTSDEKYKIWEAELRGNARKKFWNGKILADGLNDWTIRPNIFIAYYIYPDLLNNAEWTSCFKEALSHLWLNWGGVATIDKTSPLFYGEHTGETSESYHRGDSWYWINNLAALAMHRVDEHIFKDYISKILQASSEELLWRGYLGHMSELSSAREQRSEGAWAQGWSAAMYMEAMEEIMKPQRSSKASFEKFYEIKVLKPSVLTAKKPSEAPCGINAKYESSHHRNLLRVYEIILVIVLLFSISVSLGAAAFAAML